MTRQKAAVMWQDKEVYVREGGQGRTAWNGGISPSAMATPVRKMEQHASLRGGGRQTSKRGS